MPAPGPLEAQLPPYAPPPAGPDDLLERFLSFVSARGLELYPAQEEALLELMQGRHVILGTPTGSGKSLVAMALHFKALAEGRTSFYTSPIKALVNEKFFDLCAVFGAQNVGMLTGDASVNRGAPIVCCTAEILANLALREGEEAGVDAVVMDEFHYYGDRDRGVAWHVPLITLRRATFLLMSATLGDTTEVEKRLQRFTGRPVAAVRGAQRPVPLDYEYRETPLHETLEELVRRGKAPVYLVHFTQRACAEQAQALTSVNLLERAEKEVLKEALAGFRFDTPYGKDLQRYLRHGVGVHHAGLLPKYRRLVERLAQQNLLRIICGTDTLGVGVNVPIRTVLFTQLCKFDGARVGILTAREFHQIAGRAGRKGFDVQGSVVAQAPEHVIENLRLAEKQAAGKASKKAPKKQAPTKGYAHWDRATFERLVERPPEPLEPRFEITHGMLLHLLQARPGDERSGGGYRRLVQMIEEAHVPDRSRRSHRRRAAVLFRALRRAGIVQVEPVFDAWPRRRACSRAILTPGLQRDFSLHHTLSLYLLAAVESLDRSSDTYALDVLSLVEAILDNPQVVLFKQVDRLKSARLAELKAEGVEYAERLEELEKVEYPKPLADFVYATFDTFAAAHPWLGQENIRPKSVARDVIERGATFNEYVRELGLERSEGALLRYLTDAYKTLAQGVPESFRDDALREILAWLRVLITAVDSSLLEEWEGLRHGPEEVRALLPEAGPPAPEDPAADPRAFAARIRAELLRFVRAVALRDWEEAISALADPDGEWTPERLAEQAAPLLASGRGIDLTPRARKPHLTHLRKLGPRSWEAFHTLLGPDGEESGTVECLIDLERPHEKDRPLISLRRLE